MEKDTSLVALLTQVFKPTKASLEERKAELKTVFPPYANSLHLEGGTILLHAGESIEHIDFLCHGSVYIMNHTIDGKRVIHDTLSSPQILGIIEVQCGLKEYKGTVVTLTPCLVVRISNANFQKQMKEDSEAMVLLLDYFAAFALHTIENSGQVRALKAGDKLHQYLYSRCIGKHFPLKITDHKSFMADAVGISERSLFRHLESMEHQQILQRTGQDLIIEAKGFQELERRIRRARGGDQKFPIKW